MKRDPNFHNLAGGLYLTEKFIYISRSLLRDEDVEVIFDLGSRDGVESLAISHHYQNAKIYAFECNSVTLPLAHELTLGNLNIEIVEKAVLNYSGKTKFNVVGPDNEDYNPGASSVFQFGEEKESKYQTTTEVEVECVRLDDWMKENSIPKVDLIWMDLQGAELLAMEGLGSFLKNVKVIHTEVELRQYYKDQPLANEVEEWFDSRGFSKVYVRPHDSDALDTDYIFVNRSLMSSC